MYRTVRTGLLLAATLSAGACADFISSGTPEPQLSDALTSAFSTVPVDFSNAATSYAGEADGVSSLWLPGANARAFGRSGLMGGGLNDNFAGAVSAGRGFGHHGPFGGRGAGARSCNGAFNAATGWFVCDPITRNGITINQQMQYKTTAGAIQPAFDTASTNSVQVQGTVAGTISFVRDSSRGPSWGGRKGPPHIGRLVGDSTTILTANTTLNHRSDRTVAGLATGSTRRTVNGTALGEESTTGTSSKGNFTARRVAADSTRGLVIPIVDGGKTYPTAGTVIRVMTASVTFANAAPVTASRREVITYDGTDIAKIVITINGDTKNCTMQLPKGRLNCG
jgi:hypothetical protein